MSAVNIDGSPISKPIYPFSNFIAPLDGRQKIYVDSEADINEAAFNNIPSLYPHLRVHVHKKEEINAKGEVLKEVCIGVYEIDDLTITWSRGVPTITVKSYHQVYSTAQGTESAYKKADSTAIDKYNYNEAYKNIIFYASDTKKVYLNGELYGGSEGNWSIDEGDETFNNY